MASGSSLDFAANDHRSLRSPSGGYCFSMYIVRNITAYLHPKAQIVNIFRACSKMPNFAGASTFCVFSTGEGRLRGCRTGPACLPMVKPSNERCLFESFELSTMSCRSCLHRGHAGTVDGLRFFCVFTDRVPLHVSFHGLLFVRMFPSGEGRSQTQCAC